MTVLKKILESRGMSQNQLSYETRIPTSNLSMIVNGKMTPYQGWRKRISDALEIPEETLFPESESNEKKGETND